jgi:hypothetical protein
MATGRSKLVTALALVVAIRVAFGVISPLADFRSQFQFTAYKIDHCQTRDLGGLP